MQVLIDILKVIFASLVAPITVQLIQEFAAMVVKQLTSEGKLRVKVAV